MQRMDTPSKTSRMVQKELSTAVHKLHATEIKQQTRDQPVYITNLT